MKSLISILLVLSPFLIFGQECDCESNYLWVKKTFEENDAGFSYALERKGEKAYKTHNQEILQKAKSINNSLECTQTLYQWLSFFRSGHIGIRRLQPGESQASGKPATEGEIRAQYKDWEKLEVDVAAFEKSLQTKDGTDFEGIYVSGPYRIGIKKVENQYLGFIIEADGVYWTKGQVKLRIREDDSGVYYMQNHSAETFDKVTLIGNTFLEMGFITLKRTVPKVTVPQDVARYYKAITSDVPYFEQLDPSTCYLRIPYFASSEKTKIDSVISLNKKKILSTKNLIIDLRNNGGGSDRSFRELLPILYTDTIKTIGMEFLSTPMNNQRTLDFINDPNYNLTEAEKQEAQKEYDILSQHIGEFVNTSPNEVHTTTFDEVHPYPEKVGIIINKNNGSTTEQFLLAAKQSEKVKLFGTTTMGVLDISNMHFVPSPCKEFELAYCLSKSLRLPEMAIDDKGIQPDFYIHKSTPKHQWLKFVRNVLKE